MVDKEFVQECVDNFNMRLDMVKNEIKKGDGSFDFSIANFRESRACIDALQDVIRQMKQEEHDLTQDVYNKFKDKNYSHNIKF